MKLTLVACSLALASAQFGRRNVQRAEAPAAQEMPSDVDVAMAGWEQLSQNPGKMREVMESFKDPEVQAKAQEMLKDPQYMAAAKKKLADLQAKAQARGMLDENGMPVPGAATTAASNLDAMMAAAGAAGMGGMGDMGAAPAGTQQQAREWELENAAKYRAGELNDAELGMANMRNLARDPEMLKQTMDMFKDPNTMAEVKKMMADPTFKAQAQAMMDKMKASGQMPDMSQMMAGMGGSMGGGAGAGMGGAGMEAELARLRRENAALRSGMGSGMRDEL